MPCTDFLLSRTHSIRHCDREKHRDFKDLHILSPLSPDYKVLAVMPSSLSVCVYVRVCMHGWTCILLANEQLDCIHIIQEIILPQSVHDESDSSGSKLCTHQVVLEAKYRFSPKLRV
jgi:hypothetical protein